MGTLINVNLRTKGATVLNQLQHQNFPAERFPCLVRQRACGTWNLKSHRLFINIQVQNRHSNQADTANLSDRYESLYVCAGSTTYSSVYECSSLSSLSAQFTRRSGKEVLPAAAPPTAAPGPLPGEYNHFSTPSAVIRILQKPA